MKSTCSTTYSSPWSRYRTSAHRWGTPGCAVATSLAIARNSCCSQAISSPMLPVVSMTSTRSSAVVGARVMLRAASCSAAEKSTSGCCCPSRKVAKSGKLRLSSQMPAVSVPAVLPWLAASPGVDELSEPPSRLRGAVPHPTNSSDKIASERMRAPRAISEPLRPAESNSRVGPADTACPAGPLTPVPYLSSQASTWCAWKRGTSTRLRFESKPMSAGASSSSKAGLNSPPGLPR